MRVFVRVFVRVFARVLVVVFVWVGLCITWFNLGRLDQAQSASTRHSKDRMPSQTCVSKNESVVVRLVGMIVCDEWMWCGVGVVCVQSARGGRGYARYGKCVVSAVCVRCTACSTSGVRVQAVYVVCVRCVLCARCDVV